MKAGKDMTEDRLLRGLYWYRELWAEQCANFANFAFRLAELRSAGLVKMPRHLRDALDEIGSTLPLNPSGWTPEHKARILAAELAPQHEPGPPGPVLTDYLMQLDVLAELYAEIRQALREVRRKRREECGQ